MQTRIAFAPIICGLAALAVGSVPGVLSAMIDGIENFRQSITHDASWRPETKISPAVHLGLIVVGAAFIGLGLFATWWQ